MPESNKDYQKTIRARISESIAVKEAILGNEQLIKAISDAAALMLSVLQSGGTIYIAGNGGSAADAQHFAAELVGRYLLERKGIPAVALTTDTSAITSISNDYGYDAVFSRQLEALAGEGDIFFGLSTSGNSRNVIAAFEQAQKTGTKTIALTGNGGGVSSQISDLLIDVPSDMTPRIQECHILIIHILCEIIEIGMAGSLL